MIMIVKQIIGRHKLCCDFSFVHTHPKKIGIMHWAGLEPMSPCFLVIMLAL